MIIVGAKGLAKEVLEIFQQRNELEGLHFFDDVSPDAPALLYDQFPVIRNMEQVKELFASDNRFTIAVGPPALRVKLYEKFRDAGGELVSAISPYAHIGHYGTVTGKGCIIMAGTVITNDVSIGMGCLINPNCVISHDTVVGEFCEISPAVKITGNCSIGNCCSIGTGAILLPKIQIGHHAIVGAGAVVIHAVPDSTTVVGVPAKQTANKNQR